MVGHDVDALPAGVEQLADPRDDPLDLLVEVVDEPDADVVARWSISPASAHAVPDGSPVSVGAQDLHVVARAMSDRSTWIVAFVPVAALAACRSGPAPSAPVGTGTSAGFAVCVTVGRAARLVSSGDVQADARPGARGLGGRRRAEGRRRTAVTTPFAVDAGGPGS